MFRHFLLALVMVICADSARAVLMLEGSTDSLEMITSSTATTEYHVSWSNVTATALTTPGTTTGTVSSATTTTILAAPSASNWRYVRELTVYNTHASTSNDITIDIDRSATNRRQFKATLAAGESIKVDETGRFTVYDSQGRAKTSVQNAGQVANTLNTVILSTDQANSNGTANTIEDVTGLSFSVTSGETYWWRCTIAYTSAATTTGSRWTMSGPTVTNLAYTSRYPLTATTLTSNYATAFAIPAASNATSLTAGNVAVIEGVVTPSASGTMQVTHASEVLSSAITAKAGSVCQWMRTL